MSHKLTSSKLYIWKDSRLYLAATHLSIRPHACAWNQMLISIQGGFLIRRSDGRRVFSRSCILKAGASFKETNIDINQSVFAILYLNPISQDHLILKALMIEASEDISYAHPDEENLVQQLLYIRSVSLLPRQAYTLVKNSLIPFSMRHAVIKKYDPRVIKVIKKIRKTSGENISTSEYAANVNLSKSRLEKLFKSQLGVPITKFRLQFRVGVNADVRFMLDSLKLEANDHLTEKEKQYEREVNRKAHQEKIISVANWNTRYNDFLKEKKSILGTTLTDAEKQAQLRELMQHHFNGEELEKIDYLQLDSLQ